MAEITSKNINHFGQIHHGNAQMRSSQLGLPDQMINGIRSRHIAK